MKKLTLVLLVLFLMVGVFASCGKQSAQITVVTREEFSGVSECSCPLLKRISYRADDADGTTVLQCDCQSD